MTTACRRIAVLEAASLELLTRVQRLEEDVAVLAAALLSQPERAVLVAVAKAVRV